MFAPYKIIHHPNGDKPEADRTRAGRPAVPAAFATTQADGGT
jgi:hypothetical protein